MTCLFNCLSSQRSVLQQTFDSPETCPIANLPIELNISILQPCLDRHIPHRFLSLRRVSRLWNEFLLSNFKIPVIVGICTEFKTKKNIVRISGYNPCNPTFFWKKTHSFMDILVFVAPRIIQLSRVDVNAIEPENGLFLDCVLRLFAMKEAWELDMFYLELIGETPEIPSMMNFLLSQPIVRNANICLLSVRTRYPSSFSFLEEFLPHLEHFSNLRTLNLQFQHETDGTNVKRLLAFVIGKTRIRHLDCECSELLSAADFDELHDFAQQEILSNLRSLVIAFKIDRGFVDTVRRAPRDYEKCHNEETVVNEWSCLRKRYFHEFRFEVYKNFQR